MGREISQKLLNFIRQSPSCYHAVENIALELKKQGFVQLPENRPWAVEPGGRYFVARNGSSIIAFTAPEHFERFLIIAAHTDFPAFKLKENPDMAVEQKYSCFNVEKYGGMIYSTWFDRPLSIAGRVALSKGRGIEVRLVNMDRDLCMIPSLAIHMDRELNQGHSWQLQKECLPLVGNDLEQSGIHHILEREAGIPAGQVMGMDLFLYNRMGGSIWGAKEEFLSAPRLDNLSNTFLGLQAFLGSGNGQSALVYCAFDNEEVGSATRQGAGSTFLGETLLRLNFAMGRTYEEYCMAISGGFMLSADNAHGMHPNYKEKADPINRPVLNGGIVIKSSAAMKYTTDAVSMAVFRAICQQAHLPCQVYTNHSDIPGGSTLGSISNTRVPIPTVDIGIPQLAMHSAYETVGCADIEAMGNAMELFYCCGISMGQPGNYDIVRNADETGS